MAVEKIIENSTEIVNKGVDKLVPDDLKNRMAKRMEDEIKSNSLTGIQQIVISEYENVPGITPASSRDLKDSVNLFKLEDGSIISRYVNPVGFEHVFISNSNGEFVYGGFVGWIHNDGLKKKTEEIRNKYSRKLI